jgi:hypothetical protein
MKKKLLNIASIAALGVAAWLMAPAVSAQVANVSATAASSFTGLNLTTTMQNASPTTAFSNDGQSMLMVKTGATATSATLVTQATQMSQSGYGLVTLTNQIVFVPANSYILMGPFPQGRWNTQQGTVVVTFSAVTGVSVSIVSVAQ